MCEFHRNTLSMKKSISLLFRNDDICALSDPVKERQILEIFEKYQIPQVMCVIPNVTEDPHNHLCNHFHLLESNPKIMALMKEYLSKGLIEIAQHGWTHQTNVFHPSEDTQITETNFFQGIDRKWLKYSPKSGCYNEFSGLSEAEMVEKISQGKKYLENLFQIPIDVFVFPWNSLDRKSLQAVAKCGFTKVLCARNSYNIKDLTSISDLNEYKGDILKVVQHIKTLTSFSKKMFTHFHYHSWMLSDDEIQQLDLTFNALTSLKKISIVKTSTLPGNISLLTNLSRKLRNFSHQKNLRDPQPPCYVLNPLYYVSKITSQISKIRNKSKIKSSSATIVSQNLIDESSYERKNLDNLNQAQKYTELQKLACSKYNDLPIVYQYFKAYKEQPHPDIQEQCKYLQLNWYHSREKWPILNKLGDLYENQGKHSLAFMCYSQSLYFNNQQSDIFHKMSSLEPFAHHKLPHPLKENLCTVSVIMPTYNRADEIQSSIQSVLQQTYTDFELIIVNDGGSDELDKVIRQINSVKIKYIKLPKNLGVTAAVNRGILEARGTYIAYCDDDDIFYPDHLQVMVSSIQKFKVDFVYSTTLAVNGLIENGKFQYISDLYIWDEDFDKDRMVGDPFITTVSMLHRKSIFEKVGLFNEDFTMSQDWEFWLRAAKYYKFKHIHEITGEYRHKNNNSVVRDRISAIFCCNLINNFYANFEGKLASLKYHMEAGEINLANQYYKEIKKQYLTHYRAHFLIESLINIAEYFNDSTFLRQLWSDYAARALIKCLKKAKRRNSLKIFLWITLSLPLMSLFGLSRKLRVRYKVWVNSQKLKQKRGFGFKPDTLRPTH